MRITESRIRMIIRQEARQVLREGWMEDERALRQDHREVLADIPDDLLDELVDDPSGPAANELWSMLRDIAISSEEYRPNDWATDTLNHLTAHNGFEWEQDRREADSDGHDDSGGGEDERTNVKDIIEQYKDEGPRSWMRVSNDFHEMAGGGMGDIAKKYYPGLTPDDFRTIVRTLDRHFGVD